MTNQKNIQTVLNSFNCCGCTACVSICPKKALSIIDDSNGFISPKVDEALCISCGKCLRVCPSLEQKKSQTIVSYAAMSKKPNVLMSSSSGGVFSVIASFILNNGGVVYGATLDSNYKVKHIRVSSIEELPLIQRSKYVQSNISNVYELIEKDLKSNIKVLFTGTPCQVSAVKNFFPKSDNLITIDVVCHGVPSQKIFDSYIKLLEKKEGAIDSFTFRPKRILRNGMNWFFSYKVKGKKKIVYKNWPQDVYMYLYMMSYINRDSCYRCQYTTKDRVGDLTLCDYWHWENYHNEFKKNSTVSGILVNTKVALDLFYCLKDQLEYKETSLDHISKHNSCLVKPSEEPKNRAQLLNRLQKEGFENIEKEYKREHRLSILKNNIRMTLPQRLINFISCLVK